MMHFVRTVSIMRAYKATTTHIVMKRFETMEKFYLFKTLLKMACEGYALHTQHTPHPPLVV